MAAPIRTLVMVPTVDPTGLHGAGGAERMARNLCLNFDRARIEPQLLTFHPPGKAGYELAAAGVKVHVIHKPALGGGLLSKLAAYRRLRDFWTQLGQLIQAQQIDAALSMLQGTNFHNLQVARKLEDIACLIRIARIGVPMSIARHEGRLSERADALIAPSQAALAAVPDCYRVDKDRRRTIANGCQVDKFPFVEYSERSAARRRLGLPHEGFLIYSPSRIAAIKGQDVLAMALESIPEILAKSDVHWVNTGLSQDPACLELVRQHSSDFSPRVHLLDAVDDVAAYYAAADLVVIPSRSEAFTNALLEAAASGRPVLTTASGAGPEVLKDYPALIAEPDSVSSLVGKLSALIQLPEMERAQLGEELAGLIREQYTIQHTATHYADLIEECVARRRSTHTSTA